MLVSVETVTETQTERDEYPAEAVRDAIYFFCYEKEIENPASLFVRVKSVIGEFGVNPSRWNAISGGNGIVRLREIELLAARLDVELGMFIGTIEGFVKELESRQAQETPEFDDIEERKILARNLLTIVEVHGLTRSRIGVWSGHGSLFYNIISCKVPAGSERVVALARELGVDAEWLIEREHSLEDIESEPNPINTLRHLPTTPISRRF